MKKMKNLKKTVKDFDRSRVLYETILLMTKQKSITI